MGLLFGRKIELRLYTTTQEIVIPSDYDIAIEVYAASKRKTRNTAKATIFGLSEDQRALFGPDLIYLEIHVGYGDEVGMVFRGSWDERDTKKKKGSMVRHIKSGPVWQTDIETGDGLKETSTAFFSRSYPAGITLAKILSDIFAGFGLPVSNEFTRSESETLLHAATFTGKSAQILDDLAWSYKFDWSIQHGSVLVTERDEPSQTQATATVLSHSTGLVGDPVVTAEGIECTTMMLATIKPKGLIEIKDETISGDIESLASRVKGKDASSLRSQISQSGIYVVDEITYYGDNRSGDFNCAVKALFE